MSLLAGGRRLGSAALLAATIALAGCATSPPCSYGDDANFFSATANVATAEYRRCTEHLRNELLELEVEVEAAQRRADRLERRAGEQSREEREALNRLAKANRESEAALGDLNRMRQETAEEQARLNELAKRQAELEEEKRRLSEQALGGDAARLNAEIAALERQQDALRRAIQTELQS